MKTATLVVNPAAGRAGLLRAQMPAMKTLLKAHGYDAEFVETSADPGSAAQIARQAVSAGSSLVIACGGDGTVHGAVQGVARTDAALGVLPLGTANALARNLGLPLDPLSALERLLSYTPRRIPLGHIDTATHSRWFAVMAGCGPDGALVHSLSQAGAAILKKRFGRTAYYGHAARLFFTRRWPVFRVELAQTGQSMEAVALMASRVPDLGGVFSGVTRQARMTDQRLQVQVVRPPARLSLPAWMACGRMGWPNPWVTTVEAEEVRCVALSERQVYAQADAEPVGTLPMTLRVVPDALLLLLPPVAL
jgi:diacylglycerol kinase family enzyme